MKDKSPKQKNVWNRIPDEVSRRGVDLVLAGTALSLRELAVTFTHKKSYFVSKI